MAYGFGGIATGGVSLTNPDFGKVDVRQLPRVVPRIVALAMRYPKRVAPAIACSLGAAIAQLTLPHLFGGAVNQVAHLLSLGARHAAEAQGALLVTAAIVLVTSTIRGLLTMTAGYQGEWVSQRVGYDLRNEFFKKL